MFTLGQNGIVKFVISNMYILFYSVFNFLILFHMIYVSKIKLALTFKVQDRIMQCFKSNIVPMCCTQTVEKC